jgi:hypothetical protein
MEIWVEKPKFIGTMGAIAVKIQTKRGLGALLETRE